MEDNGQLLAEYAYNGARQRVAKTVYTAQSENTAASTAGNTTYFTWHGGLLDAELDAQGRVQRRTIYLNLRPVALVDYGYSDSKENNTTPEETQRYAIHSDQLGTPQAITDAHQTVVWLAKYDAFGKAQTQALPRSQVVAHNGFNKTFSWIGTAHASTAEGSDKPFEFNLRFAGQYEDAETGWHYNWHRFYDPETGRYLTPDPIGLRGGANAYGYVGGDPFQNVDPLGLEWEMADGPAPWVQRVTIGREVHSMFSAYIEQLAPIAPGGTFGANNTYAGTFGSLRPDAYYEQNNIRHVWELKPLSNRTQGPLRDRAEGQVNRYLRTGNRTDQLTGEVPGTCGGWSRGDGARLFDDNQLLGYVNTFGNVYEVRLRQDNASNSGLVFYEYFLVESWQDRLSQQVRDALTNSSGGAIIFLPGPGGIPIPI